MKGLRVYPQLTPKRYEKFINDLVALLCEKGTYSLTVTTPKNKTAQMKLEVTKRPKSWFRVLIDTYTTNYDITGGGQKYFVQTFSDISDILNHNGISCGKRVIRMDVKRDDIGSALMIMLMFIQNGNFIKDIRKK